MSGEKESTALTAAKAISAISSLFAFLEKAAVALFMMFMERAKIKQKKAEDEKEKAQSDTAILKHEMAVDKQMEGKSDADVIDDFINEHVRASSQGAGSPAASATPDGKPTAAKD